MASGNKTVKRTITVVSDTDTGKLPLLKQRVVDVLSVNQIILIILWVIYMMVVGTN